MIGLARNSILSLLWLLLPGFSANSLVAQESDRFVSIRNLLDDSVKQGVVAGGTVLVYHHGKECFSRDFGYADLKAKDPFKRTTPVVIASISKPLLGTAIYRLILQNKLNPDTPISKYLPEFLNRKLEDGTQLSRAPTISELLTHTSGIRHDEATEGRIWYQNWAQGQSLEFVIEKVAREFPFKSQPGTKYAYSGIGTDVAARVAEVVSGMPRNQLLNELATKPLGMTNTFYLNRSDLKKRGLRMPSRYFRNKDTGKLLASKKRVLPMNHQYNSSGGSIVSTAPDLMKWLMMIRNRGTLPDGTMFLPRDFVETMLTPKKGSYNALGGLFVRRKDNNGKPTKYTHTGSSGTNVWIDIEHDIIGIMLTQTRGSDIKDFRKKLESGIEHSLTREYAK